jgi:hypothetical protein
MSIPLLNRVYKILRTLGADFYKHLECFDRKEEGYPTVVVNHLWDNLIIEFYTVMITKC